MPSYGLDIDGVLADFERTARHLLEHHRGYENLQVSNGWNAISHQVSRRDWSWLWEEGHRYGLFRICPKVPGALFGVRSLANTGDISYVTSRPGWAANDTRFWLTLHDFPPGTLHVVSEHPKSSVPCDVYIDDKPENCSELACNTSARVLLFDQPWNRHETPPGVERVHGWDETVRRARVQPSEHPPVIGLTGYARSGKDSVAAVLAEYGYRRAAFADALKDIATAIGWDGSKGALPNCGRCGMLQGRRLLQVLGSEGCREHLGDDVWIRALERKLTPGLRWAISDVRYLNEAEAIRRMGGEVWRVSRPGTAPDGHASETGVDEITPDRTIYNYSTLEDLAVSVRHALPQGEETRV